MNKRNFFSLLTLLGVASISMAGIFHETDEDHTAITGRRKSHLLHGGKSKSERHADRAERTETTKTRSNNGRTRTTRTKKATTNRYRKPVND